MKAIVVESGEDRSVILAADGSYHEVKGCRKPGEEIEYRPFRRRWIYSAAALAAAFLVFFSGFTFFDQNYKVYATVEMKGDASIEYSLNGKDEIVRIKALDTRSEDIVEELKEDGVEKRVHIDEGIKRTKKIIKKRKKTDKVVAELIIVSGEGYTGYAGRRWSGYQGGSGKKSSGGEEAEDITEDGPEDEGDEEQGQEGERPTENDGTDADGIVDDADGVPAEDGGDQTPETPEMDLESGEE